MSDGFVYFIQEEETGRIKIGFSEKHPNGRLKDFQTGNSNQLNLLGFIEGTFEDETRLHNEFSEERIRDSNEWFESSSRLKERIKELLEESLEDKKKGINHLSLQNLSDENEGEGKDLERSVKESFTLPNGDKYVGQFKDDSPHGQGTWTFYNDDFFKEYEGEWKEGKKHGQGTLKGKDYLYWGDFKDDKIEGKGVLVLTPDGDPLQMVTEEGEFKEGHLIQGSKTFPAEDSKFKKYKEEGEFRNGELWNGSVYDYDGSKKGDLILRVVDGKEKKKPLFGW